MLNELREGLRDIYGMALMVDITLLQDELDKEKARIYELDG